MLYNEDTKQNARNFIISHVLKDYSPDQAIKILTLPHIAGHCAKLFKQTWQNSQIVGIDQSDIVVKNARELVGSYVDFYFNVRVNKINTLDSYFGLDENYKMKEIDGCVNSVPVFERMKYKFSDFDFIFLDYCRPYFGEFHGIDNVKTTQTKCVKIFFL